MARVFLQQLHDLCHEYEAHKSQIKEDKNVHRVLKECWRCFRPCFPEDLDHLFKCLHEMLHGAQVKPFEELPPSPEEYDFQSLGTMLKWSNMMMMKLKRQTDIILKGRCPECGGDLVEDVVFNSSKQKYELRLRCKQQGKPNCSKIDFHIQDLKK